MTRTAKIAWIIGGVGLISGISIYLYIRSTKSTEEQFDQMEQRSNEAGYDIFDNISSPQRKQLLKLWKKNLTSSQAEDLITSVNAVDKASVSKRNILINKWRGTNII